ncbi:hypothetical protein GCM10027176_36760 [Actinoallomurus bryophytorum]|uniref:Uncharacterized protein n=1 Tax=Actinoallomurus bryophytorum TaxID=1490222 RepID=A0A543CIS8_9ACTN|nr:hypothetical protein [Actinoallomurus bryophytorum]TQL97004.1 hypothetical protein FB559_2573 [Actinoallomurus bryophytorum]
MLQELVVAGGSAVVGAMATESWTAVREGVVRLFRHRGEEELAAIEAQLDGNAALMAQSADVERARQSLAELWALEFERLLDERPEAADELGALVERLGVQGGSRVQTNIARDNGRVFASLGGNVIIHEAPVPAAREESGEGGTEG